MKTTIRSVPLVITFLCLVAVGPKAQAVVPAPDGGYSGFNTAEGQNALFSLTTGVANAAVGWYSLFSNTDGSFNTALGTGTLLFNVGNQSTGEGTKNTAVGTAALLFNATGDGNSAFGMTALENNTTGSGNTAVGAAALYSSNGTVNTAIGNIALSNNTTGNFNVAVGFAAGSSVTTANNVICIGSGGENVNNTCYINNIRGTVTVNNNALPVVIDSSNQLGTTSSSRRFKKDIKPMDESSEVIFALKPVTFRYKSDKTNRPEFGLVAEEVAEINSHLVVRDDSGDIYTVRYDAVNAMLLNEFLKEHKKVEAQQSKIQKQEAAIAQLTQGMHGLTAQIKEQAAQIQKVSAQIEAAGPAPQTALNR